MERRSYVAMVTTMGISSFSGCGAIQSALGGEDAETERVKNEAKSPNWGELLQDVEEWKGEPVHYPNVRRESLDERTNGSYVITVDHPEYSTPGAESLRCEWYGDRDALTESMDIWGTFEGTHTYSFGDEETVPDVHLVDVQPSE